jgi:hypothetical protein
MNGRELYFKDLHPLELLTDFEPLRERILNIYLETGIMFVPVIEHDIKYLINLSTMRERYLGSTDLSLHGFVNVALDAMKSSAR